jgi:hypothetical protein
MFPAVLLGVGGGAREHRARRLRESRHELRGGVVARPTLDGEQLFYR